MPVVATPGGFQGLREKETIVLKSNDQLKGAKCGSFHVCMEMPKQFAQTLLKCATRLSLHWCLFMATETCSSMSVGWLIIHDGGVQG